MGRAARARPWSTRFRDPDVGSIGLSGELLEVGGSNELVLIVHGLGGCAESYYCRRAARIISAAGWSSLSLSLRGADRRGDDFYHIGLTADLEAALASPELSRYQRIFLLGYSMGGHVALHYARRPGDARVGAVASVCTPLDLSAAQGHIDGESLWLYRARVLQGLKAIYCGVAARRAVPTDPARVRRVRTIYEWDALTIVPRYGFRDPEEYYARLSIGRHLHELRLPSLLIAAERDPIIPPHTIRPHHVGSGNRLDICWAVRGGHVNFPRNLDLGFGAATGLESQVLAWFSRSRPPSLELPDAR